MTENALIFRLRQDGETTRAFAAFVIYSRLPVHERSIDAAWRVSKGGQGRIDKRAPGRWRTWATNNNWVARSAAYDEYLAEQDRLQWEKRRADMRERDWQQAEELRRLVDDAIPHAQQFIRSKRTFAQGQDGEPDREIITLNFDITGLTRVLVDASKLQRLAADLVTDNIHLSGAALDAVISRELARVAGGNSAAKA